MLWLSGSVLALIGVMSALATGPVKADEKFVLVTGDDYPPYVDTSLPDSGLSVRQIIAVFAHAGKDVSIEYMPWKRGFDLAKIGHFDGTFPYVHTDERAKHFLYSEPIDNLTIRAFGSARGSMARWSDNLVDKIVCLPLGYAVIPPLEKGLSEKRLTRVEPADLESCFRMIELQRADFVPADQMVAWSTISKIFGSKASAIIRPLEPPIEVTSYHLLVPKARPELVEMVNIFNQSIKAMRESGEMDRVAQEFLPPETPTR